MLQDWEKLAEVLDRHRPGWALRWASQSDLRELSLGEIKIERLKERVAFELFHPILHAALEAGLVVTPPIIQRTRRTANNDISSFKTEGE